MDTKRLIIAFSLSAAVMILWTVLFPPKPDPRTPAKPAPAAAVPVSAAASPATAVPAAAAAPGPARAPAAAPVAVTPVAASTEETISIDRPLYTAVVTNRGGALRSFVLKKYLDAKGKPLDLVRHGSPYPGVTLTLDTADPFLARAAEALFSAEKSEADGVTTVRFRYREAEGNGIVRTFVFRSDYQVSAKAEREGGPSLPVALVLGPGIGNPSAEELANQYTKPGTAFAVAAGGSVTTKPRGDLKEPLALGAGLVAAGHRGHLLRHGVPAWRRRRGDASSRDARSRRPRPRRAERPRQATSRTSRSSPAPERSRPISISARRRSRSSRRSGRASTS